MSSGAPCGACKFLRRKCVRGCVFAPYFGAEQGAAKFAAVHKIFGASNVAKLLLHIPVPRRCDAVITISYEAQARLSDPVYGCVATIFALQQQVSSLQAELAMVQAANRQAAAAAAALVQQHHHQHLQQQLLIQQTTGAAGQQQQAHQVQQQQYVTEIAAGISNPSSSSHGQFRSLMNTDQSNFHKFQIPPRHRDPRDHKQLQQHDPAATQLQEHHHHHRHQIISDHQGRSAARDCRKPREIMIRRKKN
ncbi:unnamed protein product [Sphagnum jensenii]|uniref:LOB domain-containing protein n=1 Tax=Sphagnum jensenii TaxID=128206 RepID=A0ABP1BC31_9BRYO